MKPYRFSLTLSIPAFLACLLGLTWILLSLISFKTAEKDLLAQKNEEVRVLLSSFLGILSDPDSLADERSAAARFVARLARERDFAGLVVVDGRGETVYAFPPGQQADSRLRETVGSGAETSLFSRKGRTISRYAPLRSGGRVVGAARLSLSLVVEYERLGWSRHVFLAYFVLDFLLLLGLGSYLLSRIVVVPLRKLLTATERIAAGDYSHGVSVPGSAEVAELAESFTLMQEALKTKRDEAERHVASLEQANRALQEAREETIRTEKMASVGLLAAGMAHEIGTPLAAIIGYVGIVREELRDDPAMDDYLRRIEEGAGRIDRLVRGLLDYARPSRAAWEEIDPESVVRDTVTLCADQGLFGKIEISLEFAPGIPAIRVDRHQLQQVLINLFLNARDAMPDGGRMTVSVRHGRGDVEGAPEFPVRIEVADTGTGIPSEHLGKIFDPFFTTKEPGKGTGLGLAICGRIIDTFRGRITVAGGPGGGTLFTIWLPAANDARLKSEGDTPHIARTTGES